jgi:two-component system chemotaxis response regulator CheY
MIIRKALRRAGYEQYAIEEACSGQEALHHLSRSMPALILCEWRLPDMEGFALFTSIAIDEEREVPFGFITSEMTKEIREQAIAAGARFLIGKPFTADTLEKVLRPILPFR